MIPNDGTNAMCMCGVLLVHCDDKAMPPPIWVVLASSEAYMWSPTVVPMPARVLYTAYAS